MMIKILSWIPSFLAGILVTASQDSKKAYSYNTVTAVLLTELIKLVISAVMYSHQ